MDTQFDPRRKVSSECDKTLFRRRERIQENYREMNMSAEGPIVHLVGENVFVAFIDILGFKKAIQFHEQSGIDYEPVVFQQAKEPLALTSKVEPIRDEFQNFVNEEVDYTSCSQSTRPRKIRRKVSDFLGF